MLKTYCTVIEFLDVFFWKILGQGESVWQKKAVKRK